MRYQKALARVGLVMLFPAIVNAGPLTKLHGKIKNPISDSISVSYDDGTIEYEAHEIGMKVNKDGTFALSFLPKQKITDLTITHGDQATEIFIEQGADLNMELDASNFDSTLKYSGEGSAIANFMAVHMLQHSFMNNYGSELQKAMIKEIPEFEKTVNEEKESGIAFLKKYKKGLPETFVTYWTKYYEYGAYSAMLNYPLFHEIMKQHTYSLKGPVPRENYEIVKKVPAAFDDRYIDIYTYRQYAEIYYDAKMDADGFKTSAQDRGGAYRKIDSINSFAYKNMPPKTAEYVVGSKLTGSIKSLPQDYLYQQLMTYKKHFGKSQNAAILEKVFNEAKRMSPGQPAIDFSFKTIDGKQMKLSDLKGKVVLLDFWASWCGPCMMQMPYAKKIEEKFKDKDVVFLYVSIDEDAASWKSAITKASIEGVHTISPGWKGQIPSLYGVRGVPAYFLIDKKGNFALREVPRPNEGDQLENAIQGLLNKK